MNMTEEEISFVTEIEHNIENRTAFAVYRLPGSRNAEMITSMDEAMLTFQDIEALNGHTGFVFAPFRSDATHPIILLSGKRRQWTLPETTCECGGEQRLSPAACTGEYAERFGMFKTALETGEFRKLVMSRCSEHPALQERDFARLLLEACRRYPDSYVYMVHTPQTGIWMGATPEILLSGDSSRWHIVALAGTRPVCHGEYRDWDEKNLDEQACVARYIRSCLESVGIAPTEEGPYTAHAGALVHLKSDFFFTMPDRSHLGSLLKRLHPTPAVCGVPKQEACHFILEHEGYDRSYYSGFLGMLNPDAETHLYVNLRSLSQQDGRLRFYAGGGLLPASQLEEEWQETENKMRTMRSLVTR